MSIHDSVADCPQCGKRDFVQTENGPWVCLNCKFSEETPKPHVGTVEPTAGQLFPVFLIIALALAVMMV